MPGSRARTSIWKSCVAFGLSTQIGSSEGPSFLKHCNSSKRVTSPSIPQTHKRPAHHQEHWAKSLAVILHAPSDVLPLDLMVAHQLRMMSSSAQTVDAIVLVNEAPWYDFSDNAKIASRKSLENIVALKIAKVRRVNYSAFSNGHFLEQFFTLKQALPESFTLDVLFNEGWSPRAVTYFAGYVAFMDQCRSATHVEICVYLDSDIFLYRSRKGIADLAPKVFRNDAQLIILQPPSICESHVLLRYYAYCPLRAWGWVSTRHVILNRSRFLWKLPLTIELDHMKGVGGFELWDSRCMENLLSEPATWRNEVGILGRLICGGETFAIHPDQKAVSDACTEEVCPIRERLRHMIEQIEAGRFELPTPPDDFDIDDPQIEVWNPSVKFGCSEPVTGNMCSDMYESTSRIAAGLAW